ncbi:MAG: 3-hexulose-6-phosphate synthase [Candidatus Aenigmatarchaeota archaeon]
MKLQVALDVTRIQKALKIAREVSIGGAHILEAGTPLIKAEGIKAIKKLRDFFPSKIIVADMKIMDIGYTEAEIALKAGADMVSVLGVASNQTIKETLRAAKENNGKVMADLMSVKNKVERACKLEKLGVDYLIYHIGVDENKSIKNCLEELKRVIDSVKIPVAVGGGINIENVKLLKNLRVDIIIVGRFITTSNKPKEATKAILSIIKNLS